MIEVDNIIEMLKLAVYTGQSKGTTCGRIWGFFYLIGKYEAINRTSQTV